MTNRFLRLSSAIVMTCSAALIGLSMSGARLNSAHARIHGAALAGATLHIIRVTPSAWIQDEQGRTVVVPGDTYESWTDATDGLSKVIQFDGQGKAVMMSNEIRQTDGSFILTVVSGGSTNVHRIQAPLVRGEIENGFWFGGESSLAGMRAEYANYLRQAGGSVVQDSLNGVPARRFDATSADGLLGTIWLNQNGLPIQVEANHDPHLITRFPVIEEFPAGSLSRDAFSTTTLRDLGKRPSTRTHR